MKKILISLTVVALVAPQIALASWWNPFTWRIFNRTVEVRVEQSNEVNFENKKATTTATSSAKISQQKEVIVIESKNSVISTPVGTPENQVVEKSTNVAPQVVLKQEEPKTNIVTFQNGAIAELDAKENVIHWIKEAPIVLPTPNQPLLAATIEIHQIISVNVSSTFSTMVFEWETDKLTSAKIFLSAGGLSAKVYSSESGLSTRHIVHITGLSGNTNYSYEIESIAGSQVVKKHGAYSTKLVNEKASITIHPNGCNVNINGTYCTIEVNYFENGQQANVDALTITSDDNGVFINLSYPGQLCSGGVAANSDGTQRQGNPITCSTRPNGYVSFTYKPSAVGSRTLTAVASGATGTVTTWGQVAKCAGQIDGGCNQ